jgi:hypothetical protein
MRVKVDYRSASKDNYKRFCAENSSVKITYNEWLEIIYSFNEEFRDYILETGNKEKLPFGLGPFAITKKKRRTKIVTPDGKEYVNLPIDWKKTKEKGKVIYNFNFHTEGYFFGWLWFKKQARMKFPTLWRFKPSRVSSRMIKHYLDLNKEQQHRYKHW